MIEIGKKIETREGIFYELEYNGEGNIYKNEDAFLNRPDEVCYVPEYAAEGHKDWRVPQNENCFTHNSLLALCKGNEEVCQDLFYSLEWTYPATLLDEWDSNGYFDEIEGWYDDQDRTNGMGKYKIVLTGPTGSKTPNYILSLRMHVKAYFSQAYGTDEFNHILHCISSFIDDFTFKVRNTRYQGSILKRTIRNDSLQVFNLGDEKVILTVSFTPLET